MKTPGRGYLCNSPLPLIGFLITNLKNTKTHKYVTRRNKAIVLDVSIVLKEQKISIAGCLIQVEVQEKYGHTNDRLKSYPRETIFIIHQFTL